MTRAYLGMVAVVLDASVLQCAATAAHLIPASVPRLHGREPPLLRRSSVAAWLLPLVAALAPARPREGLHLLPRPAPTRPGRAASLAAVPAHRPPHVSARVTCRPARHHGRHVSALGMGARMETAGKKGKRREIKRLLRSWRRPRSRKRKRWLKSRGAGGRVDTALVTKK